jgi:hypothetical protein
VMIPLMLVIPLRSQSINTMAVALARPLRRWPADGYP